MNNNQNTPKLRFSGFEKEFEKKQFDTIFDIISNNTLSRDNLNYDGGSTQNVHYGDILTKFGEYVDTEKEIIPFLNEEEVALKYQNATLKDGDIIIADTAEDEMVGKCIEIGNIGDRKILSGLHTIPCRLKEKYASKYMGYYLNSEAYHNKLLPLMQGVKVIAISKSGIQGTELLLSQDYAEQEKIGNFLFEIDEKIKYEKLKLDSIKTLKKSMLKKMFPKDGKHKPEIRFAGFTADWEQRKLGDICQITMGQSPDGSTYSDEPSDYILVQGNADLKDGWVNPRIWTTQKTKTAQAGDLIMSVRAPAGAMGKTAFDVVLGRGVAGIRGNEFVYQSLVKMDSDGYWKKMAAGSTFESINSDAVKSAEMIVPQDMEEQEKIGSYFIQLDALITLHQCELEKLENMKSACMKKMFV